LTIFRLQNLFSNLTKADLSLVKQISLRACALNLILIVKDKSQSALAPCQLLMHVASNATTFFQENPDIVPDSFTSSILSHLASVNDPKPGKVYREILPIIQGATPMMTPQINVNVSNLI
jgi:integrator complex subunit 4